MPEGKLNALGARDSPYTVKTTPKVSEIRVISEDVIMWFKYLGAQTLLAHIYCSHTWGLHHLALSIISKIHRKDILINLSHSHPCYSIVCHLTSRWHIHHKQPSESADFDHSPSIFSSIYSSLAIPLSFFIFTLSTTFLCECQLNWTRQLSPFNFGAW